MVQTPEPEHTPLHPANSDPATAVGVRSTDTAGSNARVHVAPQSMRAGELVTVPVPVPVRVTWMKQHVTLSRIALSSLNAWPAAKSSLPSSLKSPAAPRTGEARSSVVNDPAGVKSTPLPSKNIT